jgi:hypothetical protein
MIEQANSIIAEYLAAGFTLTLRQLYYQFVSRDLIPNNMRSYKRLGSIVNDGRLAGLIDWDAIEDRTRNLQVRPTWESPQSIIDACASQFQIDKWHDQPVRVEVWIEKDALAGVFDGVCREMQVPLFPARGYCSQSEAWSAAMRLKRWIKGKPKVVIYHFGDHDPSGIDMSRDNLFRLKDVFGARIELERLALNMDQVEEYHPPPNPAKTTDSRYASYIEVYGDESWELDALEPVVLAGLVRTAVMSVRDETRWSASVAVEEEHKRLLGEVSERWSDLTDGL